MSSPSAPVEGQNALTPDGLGLPARRGGRLRRLLVLSGYSAFALYLLCGPAASWLQGEGMWMEDAEAADAFYLVSGEGDQDRRISALVDCLLHEGLYAPRPVAEHPEDKPTAAPLADARPRRAESIVRVLVGNEALDGSWSDRDRRRLTEAMWAVRKLARCGVKSRIVPGTFVGTDGEMNALACYLHQHPEICRLALATSPFHCRRAAWRLRAHLHRPVEVSLVKVRPLPLDRAPHRVAIELAKMARDRLGLGQAPFVSRKGWVEPLAGSNSRPSGGQAPSAKPDTALSLGP